MKFLWPEMLWLLLLVPALVAGYFYLLRRKQQTALKYANLGMVKEAMGAGQRFRRHIPPLLFLLALIAMLVAVARPAAVVTLPSQHQTIILAMDVSGSMRAVDVPPNRLSAAQAAAKAFVAEQPSNVRIGVVSFAGTAAVVQMPTHNREDIIGAIDRFQLQRGTAIGSGILVSLETLFPAVEFDIRVSEFRRGMGRERPQRGAPLGEERKPEQQQGGAGEGDDADARALGLFFDERAGGGLRGLEAVGLDVFGAHAVGDVHGQKHGGTA